jgi:hypothetical protein
MIKLVEFVAARTVVNDTLLSKMDYVDIVVNENTKIGDFVTISLYHRPGVILEEINAKTVLLPCFVT